MSNKKLTKQQLLNAAQKLKQNPTDKTAILADIGVGTVGAIGGGTAFALLGSSTVPVLFGLVSLPVAAPLTVIAGGVVLGGAALVGAKKIIFDGTFSEGKRAEMLRQLEEQLREVEAKERSSQLEESDKTKFIVSLEEPLKLELISPEDAQKLISAVENGQIAIKDAIKIVEDIVKSAQAR